MAKDYTSEELFSSGDEDQQSVPFKKNCAQLSDRRRRHSPMSSSEDSCERDQGGPVSKRNTCKTLTGREVKSTSTPRYRPTCSSQRRRFMSGEAGKENVSMNVCAATPSRMVTPTNYCPSRSRKSFSMSSSRSEKERSGVTSLLSKAGRNKHAHNMQSPSLSSKSVRTPEQRHVHSPSTSSSSASMLQELKKTNDLLVTLVHRVEKTEERMQKMEMTLKSSSPSSSSSGSSCSHKQSRKKDVPLQVKVCSSLLSDVIVTVVSICIVL